MKYVSTRNQNHKVTFCDALLNGLAPDGGLYFPETFPELSKQDIAALKSYSYEELAFYITNLFIEDEIPDTELKNIISSAYQSFTYPGNVPLRQIDHQLWMLELYYGPTLSFKDYAMQLLAPLMNHMCKKTGRKLTIIGATSGDTGSAALHAFQDQSEIKIAILHPHERVSEIQRRQMCTLQSNNILNIALNGFFDDCQNIVKALFNDKEFRTKMQPSAVNSINWARIMAQIVYYAYAALSLGAPDRPVNFVVPTGNFGNILAAYILKRMGFPIEKLVIASNQNDILTRFFQDNDLSKHHVTASISPSMDIQISSNFERYLFELYNRDGDHIQTMMQNFAQDGSVSIEHEKWLEAKQIFEAYRASEDQTLQTIKQHYDQTGMVIDPHTAIGVYAANQFKRDATPTVIASTAHPAKFSDAIASALSQKPILPPHIESLFNLEEKYLIIDNDTTKVKHVIMNQFL